MFELRCSENHKFPENIGINKKKICKYQMGQDQVFEGMSMLHSSQTLYTLIKGYCEVASPSE